MAMVYKGYYSMAAERRRDADELWTCVLEEYLPDLEQVAEAAPAGQATDLQFSRLRKHCRQYVTAAGALFPVRAIIMTEKRDRQSRVFGRRLWRVRDGSRTMVRRAKTLGQRLVPG